MGGWVARTSACVGKKLGCAYGFGVGDCVDMRCDAIRCDSNHTAMLDPLPFFLFSFWYCGVDDPLQVNNKRVRRLQMTSP